MSDNLKLELYRSLYKFSEYFIESVAKNVESYGMTVNEFRVLELLYSNNEKNYTVQQISDELHIPSGSITYVLNRLVKQGRVKKIPCPTDRRASYVKLTEMGREEIKQIIPEHISFIANKLEEINEKNMQTLIELLKQFGFSSSMD